jgi:hypothetical protein
MASVNTPRKLRVTVTIEEFDPPKSNDAPNSKEFWTSVRSFLEDRIINQAFEIIRALFWWIL